MNTKETNKLPLNIQMFAEGGEGTPATGEPTPGEGEKTSYTAEEVQALLQKEGDKRVTEALKKAEKVKQAAIDEAKKLAKMSEEEKYLHELEEREKLVAQKEKELALADNKNQASKILSEKGISLELADFVVAEDAETMMSNIKTLDDAFKASVKAEVEKRLKGNTPKDNLPTDKTLTKDTFSKLSLGEMSRIEKENPTLFASLVGKK